MSDYFSGLLDGLLARREKVAVVGLGYVGLPLAVALSRKFDVVGYDIDSARVARLREGVDDTGELGAQELGASRVAYTTDPVSLGGARFIIVSVPTPLDKDKKPDLGPVFSATRAVGENMPRGAVVVYESTVYPGLTEGECGPILEAESGFKRGTDFLLGYSPERINPGDREHTIKKVIKVVSGENSTALDIVAGVYGAIIRAGVHRAPSIKVAEAAKVIENIQRDLNIALMNELSMIFSLMDIETKSVLEAASTKWNFHRYTPGLVGGHCIGVDPYYLTTKAQSLGYDPRVILAGREINDSMGVYVAGRMLKMLDDAGVAAQGAKVAVLGMTFKENVPDLRNSRTPDIIARLKEAGVTALAHDPLADKELAEKEYGVSLADFDRIGNVDGVIIPVPHRWYQDIGANRIAALLRGGGGPVIDVKSAFDREAFPGGVSYWSL